MAAIADGGVSVRTGSRQAEGNADFYSIRQEERRLTLEASHARSSSSPHVVPALNLRFVAEGDAARPFVRTFGLSRERSPRRRRRIVARVTTPARARLATFVIVRVKITPAFYVERWPTRTFKKDDAVLQIGVFGRPPAVRDVEGLTLDESDIKSLRECRVGRCGVQLSADAINRFRQEIDWTHTDAHQRANGVMRQVLVDYVSRYQQAGTDASMQYADRADLTNVRGEFLSLADSDAGGWGRFKPLRRHLFEYPGAAAPEARDLVYWSKEIVGRRPVASVTTCDPSGRHGLAGCVTAGPSDLRHALLRRVARAHGPGARFLVSVAGNICRLPEPVAGRHLHRDVRRAGAQARGLESARHGRGSARTAAHAPGARFRRPRRGIAIAQTAGSLDPAEGLHRRRARTNPLQRRFSGTLRVRPTPCAPSFSPVSPSF